MELYEYARPDVMAGKKILYVHGFASSGQSGTVRTMRTLLPNAEVIAPDLPVRPQEAMSLLHAICQEQKPDLIIGTSMGGMYAEQLHGFRRILVNPAFTLADTILKNNGLGRQEFHSPRTDGQTSFLVNKGLIEDFREVSSLCFDGMQPTSTLASSLGDKEGDKANVFGMFGRQDNLVHTMPLFASYYPNVISFEGGHYLDDSVFLHSVLPIISRIDDMIQGRSKPVVFITLGDTIMDLKGGEAHSLSLNDMQPINGAAKAFADLSRHYRPFVLIAADYNRPDEIPVMWEWIEKHLGTPAWERITVCGDKSMIIGDYLVDAHPNRLGSQDFLGTVIHFGEEPFKTWDEVSEYFGRLGGQ